MNHEQLYLHQLAGTRGACSTPPGITRLLASKACRGAIMFGDELPWARCHSLLAELAATRQCWVCAHGRPTVAPLFDARLLRGMLSTRGGHGGVGGGSSIAEVAARLRACLRD